MFIFTFYNSQTKISGEEGWIRLINLHLTPYQLSEEENRELRTQQAQYVCKKVIKNNNQKKWKLAIVGMDMNDVPGLIFNSIQVKIYNIFWYHLPCDYVVCERPLFFHHLWMTPDFKSNFSLLHNQLFTKNVFASTLKVTILCTKSF